MSEWDPRGFGAYLDAAMRNRGIRNDAELSRLSDVRQTQISNWRAGAARPSMAKLAQVAEALGVPPRKLYELAGWLDSEETSAPDLSALPREILDLIALYESMTTDAARKFVREQIEFALRGLRASTPEQRKEQVVRRRRAG